MPEADTWWEEHIIHYKAESTENTTNFTKNKDSYKQQCIPQIYDIIIA